MNRILELQRMQLDMAAMNETNETNYSTASHRECAVANADGFDDMA